MTTVGIVGGGQLARMLVLAGAPLGLHFVVVDPSDDACAGEVAPLLEGGYDDPDVLRDLADRADLATFDFENVPEHAAALLAERIPVLPAPSVLGVAQDRLAEKSLFRDLGIATAPFVAVSSRDELTAAAAEIGFPSVLKTRRLGYDGKGQARLAGRDDLDPAWEELGAVPLLLEAFVPFGRELSVVLARDRDGQVRAYPPTQNWHVDGILSASLAPARCPPGLAVTAVHQATRVAEALGYVGVLALELFEVDGGLVANELAPRVHNSGHWTVDGAVTSQFEQHLRAVAGLPLGSPAVLGTSVMLNWVGGLPDPAPVLAEPGAHWHDYAKAPRPGRKVGHATWVADDPVALGASLRRAAARLGREEQVRPVVDALRPR